MTQLYKLYLLCQLLAFVVVVRFCVRKYKHAMLCMILGVNFPRMFGVRLYHIVLLICIIMDICVVYVFLYVKRFD